MRVLATIPVFNEAEFLPWQIGYLREQGVMIHVMDNESTDDSRALCEALGVTVTALDTRGAFDLPAIQRERGRVASGYEHDWHLYGDADEWNLFAEGIVGACLAAEAKGASVIRVASYNLHYTGETRAPDPRRGFHYGVPRYIERGGITRLHRRGEIGYFGDRFRGAGPGEHLPGHAAVNLNFGPTKPGTVRAESLRRRRLAWERGMPRYHGVHLLEAEQQNHQWDRATLTHLPGTPHWPLAREMIGV